MKKSKLLIVLLVAVLVVALFGSTIPTQIYAATSMTESTFNSKLNTFKSSVYKHGSIYQDNSSGTLGWQCFGYANYLAKYIYGSFPTAKNVGSSVNSGWKITRDASAIDNLHVGDIVRYRYKSSYDINHSIFITAIDGNTVYYTDANSDSKNTVKWGNTTTKAALKTNVAKYLSNQNGSLTSYKGFVAHYTSWQDTPVLSVKYHANGGTIVTDHYEYKVTEEVGLWMRKNAGTSGEKIKVLSQGTTFRVKIGDTKTANGYTWGKTTVGEDTGWVVVSDYVSKLTTVVGAKGYYLNSSVVYKGSSSAVHVHKMTYGETSPDGLYNAFTFGLTREGYTFQGWSLATEGGTVIDQNQSLKPEDIVPDLKNGSKTVTMYAIWEEKIPEHSHDYEEIVTAPTCTEDGYTTFTCSCGDTYIDEVVESLGHNYEETHFDGNPGYTVYTCSRCGDSYTIEDEIQEALEITNTAGNQHVIKNSAISFTVELSRTEGVTYQWQRCKNGVNWTNVSYNGNKTKTVTFDAASWAQYPFRCVITDASGNKLYTDAYTYTLIEPPVAPNITSNPKDVYLISGNTATFSVEAVGSDLTYQWWRSKNGGQTWGEYTGTGGQTSSISLKVYSGQEYLYMCEVKDGYGNTLKTKVVQPHLITPVKITSQPSVVVEDGKATFSFTATGDVRTYQWERLKSNGWVDANSSSYEGFNTTTMSTTVTGTFRCRITDLAGNVTYTNQVAFTK